MTLAGMDLALFHAINGYAGDYVLDRLAANIEGNHLIKGGIVMIVMWYYWFAADNRQADRRQIIICAVIGALLALVVNRTLATFLPFRVRPMYAGGIDFHPLLMTDFPIRLENWSSFPSDNATFFFALSTGIYFLSRPLGVLAGLYSLIVAGLVRIYMGVHYPSDVVVGALLGIAVAAAVNVDVVRRPVGRLVDTLIHRAPGLFYAGAFAVTLELALVFDDVRDGARSFVRLLRHYGVGLGENIGLFGFGLVALLMLVGFGLWRYRVATRSAPLREDGDTKVVLR